MSALDQKLTARVAALHAEIKATEAARAPIDELVAAALANLDRAVEAFRRSPFQLYLHTPTSPGPAIEHALLGMSGALMPQQTHDLIEQTTRNREAAYKSPRLTSTAKQRRLVELRAEMARAQAHAELDRRRVEREDNVVLPRGLDADPAVWLAIAPELETLANYERETDARTPNPNGRRNGK